MTRMTLLASVATLVAAPVFAETHSSDDDQTMQNSDQVMQQSEDGEMSTETGVMQDDGQMVTENGSMEEDGQMAIEDDSLQTADNDYSMDMDEGFGSGTMDSGQLDNMIRTSNIVGGDIYAVDQEDEWAEQEWNDLEFVENNDSDWENIGNITDVVLSPDGKQMGLIVSHGGFLDIGDDTVLLRMSDVKRIGTVDALDGDFNYVVRMTEDQIEAMPEVEENWY